ncbi:metal ABC transporter permease [Suttonella ornithocola]|uniref:Manganese transport system membrane protein mntB n=1 Tax=Suttonella ornithocola TaxID=279832 RepID=A0A380MYC6_9GAMM|nr:metal ABC transporter permease [Suttonella ornithocola]SUO96893.1 Manganese transport system membrane protein mntB [Suttonella ornithocola]
MLSTLVEPFTYTYMLKAIGAATLIGAACAALSVFLLLRGWSLIGDALSHAVVPGVAGAYALGLSFPLGALVAGILAVLSMLGLSHIARFKQDAIIGLVFSAFFALGLLIISINPTAISINAVIYGNILSLSDHDLIQIIFMTIIILSFVTLKWRDMLLLFFDPIQAHTAGLSVRRWRITFFLALSIAIVASLQAVGAILVIALLITPGATAYLLSDRFGIVLTIAVIIGALTAFIGAYLSYFADGVTGGLIVVLQALIFIPVFLFAPKHGVFMRKRQQT